MFALSQCKRGKGHRQEIRLYYCNECKAWHLTKIKNGIIMTVKELIEKLKQYDENLEVVGVNSIEYYYKPITEVVENGGAISAVHTGYKNTIKIN